MVGRSNELRKGKTATATTEREQAGVKSRRKGVKRRGKQGEEKRKVIRRKILKCWMWEQTIFTLFCQGLSPVPSQEKLFCWGKGQGWLGNGSKAVTSINICCTGRQ